MIASVRKLHAGAIKNDALLVFHQTSLTQLEWAVSGRVREGAFRRTLMLFLEQSFLFVLIVFIFLAHTHTRADVSTYRDNKCQLFTCCRFILREEEPGSDSTLNQEQLVLVENL